MLGSIISSMSSIGSAFADKSEGRKQRRDEEDFQREFAQNSLGWKIDDAWSRKNKIHPLASLGVPTISASPVNVRGANVPRIDNAGIGKFLDDKTINKKSANLDPERKQIENDLLKKQLLKSGDNTEPVQSKKVEIVPDQQTAGSKNDPGTTGGLHPQQSFNLDKNGYLQRTLSKDMAEIIKAVMAMLMWGYKVRIISTHNGWENLFNELIQDSRAGKKDYSILRS